MSPAALALCLYAGYLVAAFGVRAWLMYRRTGSTGYRGLSGPVGSAGWWGGVGFIAALLLGLAAPILQMLGVIDPAPMPTAAPALGVGVMLLGTALSLLAQTAMGRNWRVGVRDDETTDLVRAGLFGFVRNPFFTALMLTAIGLALLVPNPIAVAAVLALTVAIEVQVRVVEEPYLLATHGASYREYGARVGRFVPGIGRFHSPDPR
ncbi:methyltransferase family protein [Millisia brevis]|uniref:methyltransferase family protein n=1 Tax=Millisia brevis TaxID=264148 RepID=UPI000829E1A0|nr:isoprenylcysteine carboxylmethyltransferase family protein [Millisia brevis]